MEWGGKECHPPFKRRMPSKRQSKIYKNEMGNKIIIKTGEVYDFPGFCLY